MNLYPVIPAAALAAFVAIAVAPPVSAAPPSKDHKIRTHESNPGIFPVVGELSKLFTVEQMIEIRSLVKRYNPEAEPLIDDLIDANRELTAAVMADRPSEAAIRAGAVKVADARAELALLQVRFFDDLRGIAKPGQIARLQELQGLAFERIHLAADRAAWLVDTF